MILSAALASPARQASTTPASRLGWTRSPINSIEVPTGSVARVKPRARRTCGAKLSDSDFLIIYAPSRVSAQVVLAVRHAVEERPVFACAVRRRRFPVGASPTRRTLQPEATGAVMEVTKWLKLAVARAQIGGGREGVAA